MSGWFHLSDGWYFRRLSEGRVEIVKQLGERQPWAEPPYAAAIIMAAESWASVAAHLSANGETGETYREALALHMGQSDGEKT